MSFHVDEVDPFRGQPHTERRHEADRFMGPHPSKDRIGVMFEFSQVD